MKKLFRISTIVFVIGVLFKFLHWPMSGVLMVFSTSAIFISGLISIFLKIDRVTKLYRVCFAFVLMYILFRLQFYPLFQPFLAVAVLLTLVYLAALFAQDSKLGLQQITLGVFILVMILLVTTPAYKLYYTIHLNAFLNEDDRSTSYRSWDMYSWFLYRADHSREALEANKNAWDAIENYLKISQDSEAENFSQFIQEHRFKIVNKNWENYP